MALNLEKQLEFYGSYHHTPINKGIHIICVPVILMTAFLLGTNTPSLIPMPEWAVIPHLPPTLGTIATLIWGTVYVLMEPVAGGILAPLLLAGTAYSDYLTSTYGWRVNRVAIALNVVSWIAQFVGHGVFEKRAPALLDNLIQAVILAPFFVWMEILFFFGYRPELQARVEKAVKVEVGRFQKEKQAVKSGATNGQVKDH